MYSEPGNHNKPLMEPIRVQFEQNIYENTVPPSQCASEAKILMLHGHGQSGRFFYHKTRNIIECLQKTMTERNWKCYPGGIELFYPNGPLHASEDLDADNWIWGNGDFQHDLIKGIDESIMKVLGIIEKHGPFVGIIGFSTGAAIAAIITSLLERPGPVQLNPNLEIKATHPRFRFAVCFSGFKLGNPGHQQLYSPRIETPVMHFIASLDTVIPEQQTRKLIELCAESHVEPFNGTHYVPQACQQTRSVCGFILEKLG